MLSEAKESFPSKAHWSKTPHLPYVNFHINAGQSLNSILHTGLSVYSWERTTLLNTINRYDLAFSFSFQNFNFSLSFFYTFLEILSSSSFRSII